MTTGDLDNPVQWTPTVSSIALLISNYFRTDNYFGRKWNEVQKSRYFNYYQHERDDKYLAQLKMNKKCTPELCLPCVDEKKEIGKKKAAKLQKAAVYKVILKTCEKGSSMNCKRADISTLPALK